MNKQRNLVGMKKKKKKNFSKIIISMSNVSKVLMTVVNKLGFIKFPVKQCVLGGEKGEGGKQGDNCHSSESAPLGISKRCG